MCGPRMGGAFGTGKTAASGLGADAEGDQAVLRSGEIGAAILDTAADELRLLPRRGGEGSVRTVSEAAQAASVSAKQDVKFEKFTRDSSRLKLSADKVSGNWGKREFKGAATASTPDLMLLRSIASRLTGRKNLPKVTGAFDWSGTFDATAKQVQLDGTTKVRQFMMPPHVRKLISSATFTQATTVKLDADGMPTSVRAQRAALHMPGIGGFTEASGTFNLVDQTFDADIENAGGNIRNIIDLVSNVGNLIELLTANGIDVSQLSRYSGNLAVTGKFVESRQMQTGAVYKKTEQLFEQLFHLNPFPA